MQDAMRKNLLLFLLLFPLTLPAQDSVGVKTLREVVISATRAEQPIIEVPRSVTVIHGDVIARSVYQSLGDLLNAQSGLFIVGANQTPGTNQNVFVRGANSHQVAVLIDGVRITDPSTPNAAIDLSEISLANVERVEVIRGSHSTMFGGAAIGGVINIITKKEPAPGLHGQASWQGGLFGRNAWLSTETLRMAYTTADGLFFDGSVFRQDVQGLDATEKSDARPSFTADRDDFRKTDASFRVGFRKDRWDTHLTLKNTHQFTEIDNGAFSDDDNNYLVFDRKLLQYFTAYSVNPSVRISVLGSLGESERFYENDSSRVSDATYDKVYSTGTYFGNLQTHEAQVNFDRARVDGVLGAGLYRERMNFENYFFLNDPFFPFESRTDYDTIRSRTTTTYAFAQAGYSPGRFRISGGARLSRHSTAGSFLTYELNPSFIFGDLLIYGSLSSGFNAPSLYQLYDPSRGVSAWTTRGNRSLKPERSLSLEAGIKKEFSSGSYITLSAYRTRVTDAIEYVYLWNGAKAVEQLDFTDDRGDTYINAGVQMMQGLEIEGAGRFSEALSLRGSITLVNTRVEMDPSIVNATQTGGNHVQLYNFGAFLAGGFEQADLVRRPDFSSFTRLSYRLPQGVTLHTTHRYTGRRFDSTYDPLLGPYGALARTEVKAYHLVDAGCTWEVSKIFTVAFLLENLLDEHYREVAGFHTRGRSAYLRVSATF